MRKILYLNHVSELGGGEYCLLNLMVNLNKLKYKPILLLQEPGPLSKLAEKFGIQTHFLKMRGWRRLKHIPINYLVTLKHLKKLINELNIDLIHCNAYRLNPYGVLAAKNARIPSLCHIRWFTKKDHIKKFMLDKVDLVLTMSDYMASFFAGSNTKVKTVYDGIQISDFKNNITGRDKIRSEFNLKKDDIVVGMVAQITPRKGHKDFIKASVAIRKIFPKVKFMIVGGAILDDQLSMEDLEQYARDINAGNIFFTGNRNDIRDVFRALDFFVLPSHIEPFGLVILEAMASGIPVVATRSGGPQEIISDGKNGFLVPVRSARSIAEKIIYLLRNPDEAKRISKAAERAVEERFNVKRYAAEIEHIYELYLEKNSKSDN